MLRVPPRMKLAKTLFLHNFSNFTGILLFLLIYMYHSLLLKMFLMGFLDQEKIMANSFNVWRLLTQNFWLYTKISSYTQRTLCACCSQSELRVLKIVVASVHYFCTMQLRTPHAVLTSTSALQRVNSFATQVFIFS